VLVLSIAGAKGPASYREDLPARPAVCDIVAAPTSPGRKGFTYPPPTEYVG